MKKIAIHHRRGSFSDRWIDYCDKKDIPYKIVNAFDNDIVGQLHDCYALMWHHSHVIYKDVMTAKRILFALEHAGIRVFPDFNTGWHFDDKVAQKYLLEALGAPLVSTYVFYEKQEAINWAQQTNYPKVFKLKGGAGSLSVRLVRTEGEALKLINKAFGKGFVQYGRFTVLGEYFRKYKNRQKPFFYLLKGLLRFFITPDFIKKQPREKGYIYFQDFMPNNDSDVRVIVVGDKAFAVKRLVRANDFRASGSGSLEFERQSIDESCVRLAFKVNENLKAQLVAYDFVFDKNNKPLIIEISYGFAVQPYDACIGYWNKNMSWCAGAFVPQEWMVDALLEYRL